MSEKNPLSVLLSAQVPSDTEVLRNLTVGIDKISRFYARQYFTSFINDGGSAVRFVTGKHGCGKSHLLALLKAEAADAGYYCFSGSADEILLSDCTELYKSIINNANINGIIERVTQGLLKDLGFAEYDFSNNKTIIDQMSERGELDNITRAEIRTLIRKKLLNTPNIDNNFGLCCSMLISNKIGLIELEEQSITCLYGWLQVKQGFTLSQFKSEGLLPYRINKLNARMMIRSFAELIKMAEYAGLYISIDNLDAVLSKDSLSAVHYTKMRRDDAYESIRQIIDDTEKSRFVFFVFGFNRDLIDNERAGFSSYQALWMRMQNEISSSRLNYFQSLIDLDKANSQLLTADSLVELSQKIAGLTGDCNIRSHKITTEEAKEMIEKAKFGSHSLPFLVNKATIQIESREVEHD